MGKNESSKIKRTPIREAVKLRLWGMAAGRCEICNKLLYLDSHYGDDANFSENAHIHAVGKTGPRHADDMTQDEINNIDNLMLLLSRLKNTPVGVRKRLKSTTRNESIPSSTVDGI